MATPPDRAHEHAHPGLAVEVERRAPCLAQVHVEVSPEELERSRQRELAQLSQRVRLKGFRPGKIPRAVLEKHFGQEVERGVIEHLVQHAYQDAVEQKKLRPAAHPKIELGEARPVAGAPFRISFEVLLRPEFSLGTIDGLAVEGRPVEVGEQELDQALIELRRAHSHPEPAGQDGLEADGLAIADLSFYRPGSAESVFARAGLRLSPRSVPAGVDQQAFERALAGARAGETRELELTFPDNFPVAEARGERGRVRIELKEVFRIVPPADEQLFSAFEVQDQDGLRAALRARILAAKQADEDARIESELLERLIDEHPMELPAPLLEAQVEGHLAELREALQKQGLGAEEVEQRVEGERERARRSAERSLRAVYLMEEIARVRELQVSEQDLGGELAAIARRNGAEVKEVARYYREQGLLRQLGLELLERKVRHYLRTSAQIRRA